MGTHSEGSPRGPQEENRDVVPRRAVVDVFLMTGTMVVVVVEWICVHMTCIAPKKGHVG